MPVERNIRDILESGKSDLLEADMSRRLDMLVRQGLMSAGRLPLLKRGLEKMNMGKVGTPQEREAVNSLLNSMMFIVLGDDTVFQRARQSAQKNRYQTEESESEAVCNQGQAGDMCEGCDSPINESGKCGCDPSCNCYHDIKESAEYYENLVEKYTLYHKSYTDAINHAFQHHAKSGLSSTDDDRMTHVGLNSKKPSEGKTTSVKVPATHKSGKKHMVHIQVYNKGGKTPYELNTYSSGMGKLKEESLDENCPSEEEFKPHMMYDPKTGKGFMAKKYADHVRMDKMGYTHEKPEVKEELEQEGILIEKNVPTNPALWSKFKSQAKAKFDVYPSAYANGWAAKKYKAAGGGWKKATKEANEYSMPPEKSKEETKKIKDKMKAKAKENPRYQSEMAIPKSTEFGVAVDGKYVAKGSKRDMAKHAKKVGGTLMRAPGKKVGHSVGKVMEDADHWSKDKTFHPSNTYHKHSAQFLKDKKAGKVTDMGRLKKSAQKGKLANPLAKHAQSSEPHANSSAELKAMKKESNFKDIQQDQTELNGDGNRDRGRYGEDLTVKGDELMSGFQFQPGNPFAKAKAAAERAKVEEGAFKRMATDQEEEERLKAQKKAKRLSKKTADMERETDPGLKEDQQLDEYGAMANDNPSANTGGMRISNKAAAAASKRAKAKSMAKREKLSDTIKKGTIKKGPMKGYMTDDVDQEQDSVEEGVAKNTLDIYQAHKDAKKAGKTQGSSMKKMAKKNTLIANPKTQQVKKVSKDRAKFAVKRGFVYAEDWTDEELDALFEMDYKAKFNAMLKKTGKSLAQMSADEKKKFFNSVDDAHTAKNESWDLEEASAAADAKRDYAQDDKRGLAPLKKDSKPKVSGASNAKEIEHIIPQLRKTMTVGKGVQFHDGKTHDISKMHAAKFLKKYMDSKPAQKADMQKHAQASHKNFMSHVS